MLDFIEGRKNIIMLLAILFVVVSLSDTTYSLFFNADTTNTFNYGTGFLQLEVKEDKQIVLKDAFPTIDSIGMESEPYELVIKNNGNIAYNFDLKMLSTSSNAINTKYIKIMVDDGTPQTLYSVNNIIKDNVIIYPKEEKKIKIRVWLDNDTPNQELGKSFIAKIATNGESFYKTIDTSGANHPLLNDDMIPVSYDYKNKTWIKADESNVKETYPWYNYDKKMWANVVKIKDNDKEIYDLSNKHNIKLSKTKNNNHNLIIDEKYFDLKYKYNNNKISTILKVKFNDLEQNKIYFLTNGNMTYYFDKLASKFTLKIGNVLVNSKTYNIDSNKWYTIGYTYDESKVNFYVNGKNISSSNMTEELLPAETLKLGTNDKFDVISKITISDVYIYNDVISEDEFANNFKDNIKIIYDNLESGYNEFIPMTKKEYYNSLPLGKSIDNADIKEMYVWIPRYKYETFNITGEALDDETSKKGINIIFENSTATTGSILCKDFECYQDPEMKLKVTKENNGEYYTHPSFSTLSEEATGFWVSKYEISTDNSEIIVKNNQKVLTNEKLSTFYSIIKKMDASGNYKMITNTEWGAITYLAHSKYGLCDKEKCESIVANKTTTSGKEKLDSTTKNIYGVFDMAGSAAEFVMANYADEKGNISLANTYFTNIAISNKDYDLYKKDKFILGDATKEISTNSWNIGLSTFIDENNNWFVRGGMADETNTSIYSYRSYRDIESEGITSRITLK